MPTVEIIAIGNELLNGDVQDTNTHWLCRRLTGLGAEVRRCAVVRDDAEAIAAEVRQALARGPDLIVTTGGMGPTPDDMTLPAVARAIGREVVLNRAALAMVRGKYEELAADGCVESADMTPSREKMAWLPDDATPLDNPVGAAPAALLELDSSVLVCLPGVPGELKGIFETSLQPTLQSIFGSGAFVEKQMIAAVGDESLLAPILADVAAQHEAVYVKSRPRRFGPDVRICVTLSARGRSREEAAAEVAGALSSLREALSSRGIGLSPGESHGDE